MKETFVVVENDISKLAHKVLEVLSKTETPRAKVIHLVGDLGAGKTTFTKELAQLIGIEKEEVNSPTFILKKEYRTQHSLFRKLIHIDAYRFNNPEEGKVLKLEDDLKESDTLVAIEWPGKMKPMRATLELFFTVVDDDTREVTLTTHD
jgi:tRNA threonylcarbamoyladenosine biosynthesis protein TsaE